MKYHLGYSADLTTPSGHPIHLSLCFNPSHLEFVNPVATGRLRAKQDRVQDAARERGMVVLIHGDAAFAGEGVVQETLNLSQLAGYRTGGTLHVIVNNQIGFTTLPEEGRSTPYATDVARMLQVPIFHVNGEDPEAVAQVVRLALEFRRQFQRDVVIDIYCYRRHGHNEGDEPAFTQPQLYREIAQAQAGARALPRRAGRPRARDPRGSGGHRPADARAAGGGAGQGPERRQEARGRRGGAASGRAIVAGPTTPSPRVETGADRARLSQVLRVDRHAAAGVSPASQDQARARASRPAWRGASGRSTGRPRRPRRSARWRSRDTACASPARTAPAARSASGTRCCTTWRTGSTYTPLEHLAPAQAPVELINSPLSEAGVLGFEYGYSLDWPDGLVMWEAQFGDFVNAAQVIIDQFLASGEEKWRRLSGLVLLLPHGLEGMGPEHSSARLERFLDLAAEDNIQVVYPSTPAQYFHCLRRQVLRPWRKPLVVMTPKSLLRHPACVSPLEDLARGTFRARDPRPLDRSARRRSACFSARERSTTNWSRSARL